MACFPPSPTPTSSSLASYDMISARSRSQSLSSSVTFSSSVEEDIIVWGLSDPDASRGPPSGQATGTHYESDEDFVLLSRSGANGPLENNTPSLTRDAEDAGAAVDFLAASYPGGTTALALAEELANGLEGLSIPEAPSTPTVSVAPISAEELGTAEAKNDVTLEEGGRPSQSMAPASLPPPSTPPRASTSTILFVTDAIEPTKSARKRRKKAKAKAKKMQETPQGDRRSQPEPGPVNPEEYRALLEEASRYITAYLANPEAKNNNVCKLTLIQSLLIEFGLAKAASALPTSMTAGRKMLKTNVFVNIKEYVASRPEGAEAISKCLYPSRSKLMKDLAKKKGRAPLQWVKEQGLDVLLVQCFH